MIAPLVLALFVAQAPSSAVEQTQSSVKWSVSLGVGHGWGGVGARAEMQYERYAVSLGLGTLAPIVRWYGPGVAVSARVYVTPPSSVHNLFVGANGDWQVELGFFASAVVGYRLQLEHFFLEASVGPALNLIYYADRGDRQPPGWVTRMGALWGGANFQTEVSIGEFWFVPDVGVAAGWRF